jgi:hypothetical protein
MSTSGSPASLLALLAAAAAAAGAAATASGDGAPFCGTCANGGPPPMVNTMLSMSCSDPAATISAVQFASYGTPAGACGAWQAGACNAANSTAVVSAACLGQHACAVYPNTTTFGDPCFGTVKTLAVQLTCTSGTGTATCATPPAPTAANFTASVAAQWGNVTAVLAVEPSLQVVSQHFLFRSSPIHDAAFATLKAVGAKRARFVPWLPFPAYGVGELQPPSGEVLCGPDNFAVGGQTRPISLSCGPNGGTIKSIDFASFGRPTGLCGSYAINPACHAANSTAIVAAACVGQSSCTVPTSGAGGSPFGAPCAGQATWLAVEATCSVPGLNHVYWNMTLLDEFFTDFWDAVDGNASNPIPNFSSQPTWMYAPADYAWNEDSDAPWYGYTRGTAPATNLTALGDYYGRLWSYWLLNGFTDEAGNAVTRTTGPPLAIKTIEVFNEVPNEHGHTPQSYTLEFDAVVEGVRRWGGAAAADIEFVGMSLPNIDDTAFVLTWAQYFLNASNHAPAAAGALNAIGFHAYPTNGPYTPDPSTFANMFTYADSFVDTVVAVDAVIAALSPGTVIMLDETGTDMDGVLTPGLSPPDNAPRYWVASAGYFAYMFARVAAASTAVRVVGASQLMDAPGQEPSVTMLDWSTGEGTARLWVVQLLVAATEPGDRLVGTAATVTGNGTAGQLFAQAFAPEPSQAAGAGGGGGEGEGEGAPRTPYLLLVNKANAWATVDLSAAIPAGMACSGALMLDEFSRLSPARPVPCEALPGTGDAGITLAPYATAVVNFA